MTKAAFMEESGDGRFHRKRSEFRHRIEPGGRFPPEAGRYHLYISHACPWAHRTMLMRNFLGLEDVVSFDVVDWHMQSDGSWRFAPDVPGCTPDSVGGHRDLQQVYLQADPGFPGIGTVPVLWDQKEGTIVNNESREIVRMFDEHMAPLGSGGSLLPDDLRGEVDSMIDANYEPVNNAVYRAGFAQTQEAHDEAADGLFARLAELDEHLDGRDYLVGDQLTEADVCLWPTLLRFDPVYHTHFKCNRARIVDHPNLWAYLKRIYHLPGVAATVDWDHIRSHYYWSHPHINPHRIIPRGPDMDRLLAA